MAVNNWTDYSRAPLLDSPWGSLVEDLAKGYKTGRLPAELKAQEKDKALANQLKQLDVEHKPKEYELNDKQKILANAMQSKALEHYDEKYNLEKEFKQSQINKNNRPGGAGGSLKPNAAVANAEYIWNLQHPGGNATPEEQQEHLDFLKKAFETGQEHTKKATERTQVLNDTQNKRNLTNIGKKHDELRDIDKGYFPGTKDKISGKAQERLKNDLLLSLTKDVTDPATRAKLQNATNMNITLDSIDSKALTQFSGAEGKVDKMADSLLESLGAGSPEYQNYVRQVVKASAAAKQMRQYLGDSIQPSAQERLDHLTNPEAWNVSPKLAKENFEFIRDLYKRETDTLVRAATDPTLYQSTGTGAAQGRVYNLATRKFE